MLTRKHSILFGSYKAARNCLEAKLLVGLDFLPI